MANDHLANCTCYVLTLEPIDQFTLRYGAHNQACPVYRESGDYLDQKRDIEARARLESLPTTDLERAYWAEVRENRQDGTDTDTWPKRCPFTGGEIDEDGSDSCPDDCQHHRSAEFTADQARLAALVDTDAEPYPRIETCIECGRLFEPDRKGDDICAAC